MAAVKKKEAAQPKEKKAKTIPEPAHIYTDSKGNPVYGADWSNGKAVYAHLHQAGSQTVWLPGLNGQRMIYRFAEVAAAHEVVLVASEPAADALRSSGFLATTVPGGWTEWMPIYAEHLRGKRVTLLCAKDDPRKELVYQSLYGRAFDVRLLSLDAGLAQDLTAGTVNKKQIAKVLQQQSERDFHDEIQARKKRMTDTGNSEMLVFLHGERLRYNPQWGRWLVYDGTRWVKDEQGLIHAIAKETIDRIWEEARESKQNDAHYKELVSFAQRSRSRAMRSNMIELAQTEPSVQITADELDRNPHLLNFQNGTLDLMTREFRPHEMSDYLTKQCPFAYDEDAPVIPNRFRKFLDEVFGKDQSLVQYMRQVIGYSLTGLTVHQMFWMLYGSGANGKSVLTETLLWMLGDYGGRTPSETLMHREMSNSVPNDLARLQGLRLVVASELEEGRRWNESRIKDLTGGDRITARFLHREFFEFHSVLKLMVPTNHKPIVRGTDHGIQRRIKLVPFTVQIPPEKRDPKLKEKLCAEASSIIKYCIDMLPDFVAEYWEPDIISAATREYFSENDIVGQFLEESCDVANSVLRTSKKELYKHFEQHCEDYGIRPFSQNKLSQLLKERSFEETKQKGERYWLGIAPRK